MANRNFDHPWVLGKRLVSIKGSFATNGSSNPVASSIKGLGFSATAPVHATTGTYTVTFDDCYLDVNYASAHLQLPSASDNTAAIGAFANLNTSTKPTLTIYTLTGGSAADIAANANSRVYFEVTFRDSTVGQSKP